MHEIRVSRRARRRGERRAHLNLLRHGEVDDVLNLREIESLRGDTGSDHDVLLARLEGFDGVFTLFLGCEGEDSRRSAEVEEEREERDTLLLP
jgi:hypothetical protein